MRDAKKFEYFDAAGNPNFTVAPKYSVRFIKPADKGELINLFHLARTALSGQSCSRYDRMIWASREFSKAHPETSSTAAYKELDGLLA